MFVLSKVLLFLLFPVTWVFIVLIIALNTKPAKRKQQLLLLALIILYLFSCPVLLNIYAKLWRYPSAPIKHDVNYSCVILLGGFCDVTSEEHGYFTIHSDRFIQALKLNSLHKASHVLITGRNGSIKAGFDEAAWTHDQLRQLNVPDSSIIVEDSSKNTIQNAVYTKRMLAARHLKPPYLLVTSDFHMRRSMYIFKKAGIDVVPYPCNYLAGVSRLEFNSFLLSGSVIFYWEYYIKELIGMLTAALSRY